MGFGETHIPYRRQRHSFGLLLRSRSGSGLNIRAVSCPRKYSVAVAMNQRCLEIAESMVSFYTSSRLLKAVKHSVVKGSRAVLNQSHLAQKL